MILGIGALKEDTQELYQDMKAMAITALHSIESIWYAPDSLEEKRLVIKDIFADHKITWISWVIFGAIFIF